MAALDRFHCTVLENVIANTQVTSYTSGLKLKPRLVQIDYISKGVMLQSMDIKGCDALIYGHQRT